LGATPGSRSLSGKGFQRIFHEALASGGAFVVIDRKTQKIIGSSRYFGFDSGRREIEIGWTFLARSHWGGKYNAELKRLMLGHAFKFVESVVFLIGPTNVRSQKARGKIGGVLTERRTKRILTGKPSKTSSTKSRNQKPILHLKFFS